MSATRAAVYIAQLWLIGVLIFSMASLVWPLAVRTIRGPRATPGRKEHKDRLVRPARKDRQGPLVPPERKDRQGLLVRRDQRCQRVCALFETHVPRAVAASSVPRAK